MSQEVGQTELKAKTQQLLDGPLKHIRAAAIAAALLPLASVAATPASAQTKCASGGVCGTVFNDTNGNGIQEPGEDGIPGAQVTISSPTSSVTTFTDANGIYDSGAGIVSVGSPYTVSVLIGDALQGWQASPANVGTNRAIDSDGVVMSGFSVATGTLTVDGDTSVDFGFSTSTASNPGTGTPGYWKNHPEDWPVQSITIGGVNYLKADAITALSKITKDKTTTMFSSLLSAKLNLLIGNDGSCLIGPYGSTIALADAWMTAPPIGYGPLGSGVAASSAAWKIGEPLHQTMDAYNNGLLCVKHRQ
jgi:SdrD B-like domain